MGNSAQELANQRMHELHREIYQTRMAISSKVKLLGEATNDEVGRATEGVRQSIDSLKQSLSPSFHVKKRPVLAVAGAVVVGCFLGRRMMYRGGGIALTRAARKIGKAAQRSDYTDSSRLLEDVSSKLNGGRRPNKLKAYATAVIKELVPELKKVGKFRPESMGRVARDVALTTLAGVVSRELETVFKKKSDPIVTKTNVATAPVASERVTDKNALDRLAGEESFHP